jgi:hypothetical protein
MPPQWRGQSKRGEDRSKRGGGEWRRGRRGLVSLILVQNDVDFINF